MNPCPFCGAKPPCLLSLSLRLVPPFMERYVMCWCGAQGPPASRGADAVEQWNRRALSTREPS